MRRLVRWLGLLILTTLVLINGCTGQPKPDTGTGSENKTHLTENAFTLPDLSGREVKIPEDFLGKKILLVFFSTG